MARTGFSTSNYLTRSLSPSMPFTFAVRARCTDVTTAGVAMAISGTISTNNFWYLGFGVTSGKVTLRSRAGGVDSDITSTNSVSNGTWYSVMAVINSSTDRRLFLDASKNTSSASSSPGVSRLGVGILPASSFIAPFIGDLAEAAYWNVALTDDEAATYASGLSPKFIRPSNLVSYYPLIGRTSPEIDIFGGGALTITGSLSAAAHPRVYYPSAQIIQFPTPTGGITGTVSTTEADDTLSASGTVTVTGTLAVTEADDSLSASGTVTVSGSLAVTEADDTSSASGTVSSGVTGTVAVTEEDDSLSAAGAVTVTGTVAVTEADDTLSGSGTVTVTGTVNVTEADDTLSASGVVSSGIDGTLAVTEAADTLSAAGQVDISGTLAVTEAADTLSAAGTVTVSGSLATTEADDTLSAAGTVTVTGSIAANEADDTLSASGTVSHNAITGTVVVTDEDDTLAAVGTLTITGTLSVVEANDTLAANDAVLVENPFIVKVTVNEARIISVTVQGNPGWAGDAITAAGGSSVVVAA